MIWTIAWKNDLINYKVNYHKEHTKLNSVFEVFIFLITFVCIAALLYCALYAYPSGDDYGYAHRIHRDGFLDSYINTYFSWSGRYMASLLSFFNPLLLELPKLYPVYSLLLIVVFVFSIFFFVHQALYNSTKRGKLLVTSLLICTIMAGMPSFFEFFYWFSAYISYTIPCILIVILLGMLCMYDRKSTTMATSLKIILLIVAIVLVIGIIGGNELTLITIDCIIAFLIISKWRSHVTLGYWRVLSIIAILCSVLMLAAPGNFARLDLCQTQIDYFHVLFFGTIYTLLFLLKNIPLLAIMSLVYIFIVSPLIGEKKEKSKLSLVSMSLLALIGVWLMHIFTFLSTDTCPLERTENVVFVFLVFSWAIILYIIIPNNLITFVRTRQNKILSMIVMILFFFSIFRMESTINATFADILSGNIVQFANERQVQIDLLKKSNSEKTILPSLTVAPKTLTYTLYDDSLGLNAVIMPGDPFYETQAVFPIDTIRVQNNRKIWGQVKRNGKTWLSNQ